MGRHCWFSQDNRRWKYHLCSGGELRKKRKGRNARWFKRKKSMHLVLRANNECIKSGFRSYKRYFLILQLIERYSQKFGVKIEQFSIQYNHIHFLIRAKRKTNYQSFFRVLSGQIAQVLEKEGLLKLVTDTPKRGTKRKLWMRRPFSRVVTRRRVYRIVVSYIKLNELEGLKVLPYRKARLKGLSSQEWELIRGWS